MNLFSRPSVKHLRAEVSALRSELAEERQLKGLQANQERILASLRAQNFSLAQQNQQSQFYPLFPKPHQALLQKVYSLSFNPLANRILQIPVDLLHQQATPFQTENQEEEDILKAFWEDPINNFPEFSKQIIYNYGLYGEQCFTLFYNSKTKRLRLGYIHPLVIEQTILDPDNDRVVIGVKLRNTHKNIKYDQILTTILDPNDNEDDCFSPETQALRKSFFITDPITQESIKRYCFFFQEKPHYDAGSQDYGISLRGTPDLVPMFDWILATDDILSSMIERADLLSRTLWTLQVEGGNLREGDEYNLDTLRQRYGDVPKRWEVRVTNEKMQYARHDGPVGNSDMVELLRAVQLYVISGSGLPEVWFLGGINANKASSTNMEFPTLKKLEARQHTINHIFDTLFKYQVIQAGIEPSFKMVNTPLKDTTAQTLAESLRILGETLGNAEDRRWLAKEEAQTVYRKLLQELGVKLKEHPDLPPEPEGTPSVVISDDEPENPAEEDDEI